MDKRYVLIIIIIAICSINLYLISSNSDEVGAASVIAGKYVFSLPENFNVENIYKDTVSLHNPSTGLNVEVYTSQNTKYDFQKKLDGLSNSSDTHILSNGTINVDGVDVNVVYFTSGYDSNTSLVNRSTFIFSKESATFQIEMRNFDYNKDRNETIDVLSCIVESLAINYKK